MPYARLTTFRLKPGNRDRAEQAMNQASESMRKMAGFQNLTLFHDDDYRTFRAFSVWESRADAEGATPGVQNMVRDMLKDAMDGEPTTEVAEIYLPS